MLYSALYNDQYYNIAHALNILTAFTILLSRWYVIYQIERLIFIYI